MFSLELFSLLLYLFWFVPLLRLFLFFSFNILLFKILLRLFYLLFWYFIFGCSLLFLYFFFTFNSLNMFVFSWHWLLFNLNFFYFLLFRSCLLFFIFWRRLFVPLLNQLLWIFLLDTGTFLFGLLRFYRWNFFLFLCNLFFQLSCFFFFLVRLFYSRWLNLSLFRLFRDLSCIFRLGFNLVCWNLWLWLSLYVFLNFFWLWGLLFSLFSFWGLLFSFFRL